MNEQILSTVSVTEPKSQQTRQAGYTAPRMFAVGSTVELIQGACKYGWRDADNTWTKEHA